MRDSYAQMTDQEVVLITLKDKSAFAELILRYEDKLRRYIRRLGVHNLDDQLDVLQNIFLKVYRNLNDYDTTLAFSSWVYRIAHNEAVSWYRHHASRPEGHLIAEPEETLGLIASETLSPEQRYDQTVVAKLVTEALFKLPLKYQQPIILRYFEGKEYEEISDILEIPLGSVGTLLFRGKKLLENALKSDVVRNNIDI